MWAIRYTLKTVFVSSLIVGLGVITFNNQATNKFVEFLVIGEIPGTSVVLHYHQILVSLVCLGSFLFLYTFFKWRIPHYSWRATLAIFRFGTIIANFLMAILIGRTTVALQAGNAADWTNPLWPPTPPSE